MRAATGAMTTAPRLNFAGRGGGMRETGGRWEGRWKEGEGINLGPAGRWMAPLKYGMTLSKVGLTVGWCAPFRSSTECVQQQQSSKSENRERAC